MAAPAATAPAVAASGAAHKDDQPLNVLVLFGSVRSGRQAPKVAELVASRVRAHGHTVTIIDPAVEKLPLLEKPIHHFKAGEAVPEWLARLGKQFEAADAFILVDGEYNHSPTPGMLNLLDHFGPGQYRWKACGIATYSAGPTGGSRSAFTLRNTAGELGMLTPPMMFLLPSVFGAFAASGALSEPARDGQLTKFVVEWEWLARHLRSARAAGLPRS